MSQANNPKDRRVVAVSGVYKPQPTPKVLQRRLATVAPRNPLNQIRGNGTRKAASANQGVVTPRIAKPPQLKLNPTERIGPAIVQPVIMRRAASGVVQAVKFYPNLHPGAIEPIDRSNIFRLNSFADQYRLHKVNNHGVNVPNQQYNFVRTREGETLLHARYRHPSIAEGKHVLYAGEVFFNNGQLEWWSNGSGHYQPYAEDAEQANLPMDHFFSYQQVIKGEHKRKG